MYSETNCYLSASIEYLINDVISYEVFYYFTVQFITWLLVVIVKQVCFKSCF